MLKLALYFLTLGSTIAATLWAISEPDWEPIITSLTAGSALIGLFVADRAGKIKKVKRTEAFAMMVLGILLLVIGIALVLLDIFTDPKIQQASPVVGLCLIVVGTALIVNILPRSKMIASDDEAPLVPDTIYVATPRPLIPQPTIPKVENPIILIISGTQLDVEQKGKIILYTTISIQDSSGNRAPLELLNPKNFTVTEYFDGQTKNAQVLSVEPLAYSGKPIKVALLFDKSGSMGATLRTGGIKIDLAKDATKLFLQRLGQRSKATDNFSDIKVALLPFSEDSVSLNNFVRDSNHEIWTQDLEFLYDKVDEMTPNGQTPLWDAIKLAVESLADEPGYTVVVCLTDGQKTSGTISTFDSLKTKGDLGSVPVFTIGYGDETKYFKDLAILSNLSGAGVEDVGSFAGVRTPNLPALFDALGNNLALAYRVEWESKNSSPDTEVKVEIRVRYEGKNGELQALTSQSYNTGQL